jgi:hypothetical protein
VWILSEQVNKRMLTCTADGYIYHIWGDDRYLYFDKMGRDGGDREDTMLGSTRVVKTMVDAVRCTRVRGETIILIVFEGETSRLVVKGSVKEETLIKIFGGVPLKLSINLYSNVLTDAYELRLLSYCFIGLGWASLLGTQGGLLSDAIQHAGDKAGFDVSGVGNAAQTFVMKIGNGFGSGLLGWVMAAFGYDGMAAVQTDQAILGIKVAVLILPIVFSAISMLIMSQFDLYKKGYIKEAGRG